MAPAVPTRRRRITLGHLALWIEHPVDPEALFDAMDPAVFAVDERIPYWAHIWPAGVALGQLLARLDVRGRRVIELGGGMGLASLAAAAVGADVLITDIEPEALAFAQRNAAHNHLVLRTACGDWREPGWPSRFDLVIAADVLYERRNLSPLIARIPELLAPGGSLLLIDPGRGFTAPFRHGLAARGLEVESRPTYLYWDGRSRELELVSARLPKASPRRSAASG
jgi:predicted nicotinamide N-methyase